MMKNNFRKATILMVLSALSFALMATMVKLVDEIPVIEKVFFRNFVSLIIALMLLRKNISSSLGRKSNRKFLVLRSLFGLTGVFFYFVAISNLKLADSSMLNKLSPFFVVLFAGFFLKERIKRIEFILFIFAFAGALLIIKPKFDLSILPALAGLLSAICAGAAYTVVRFLGNRGENSSTIVAYFSLISVLGTLPFLFWQFKMPSIIELFLLLSIGVFAAGGQFGLTLAYRYSSASKVSIYSYSQIFFATIIGYIFWSEVPDFFSILGGIVIILVSIIHFKVR